MSEGSPIVLRTERLVLRLLDEAEAPLLRGAIADSLEHLRRWMPWAMEEPESEAEKAERIRRHHRVWHDSRELHAALMARDADPARLLGGASLEPLGREGWREIGYWLRVDAVGRGLAREATAALTRFAIEVEGHAGVEIQCDPQNRASAGVPEALGYRHEETLRDHKRTPTGALRDTMVWRATAGRHPATPAARIAVTLEEGGRRRQWPSPPLR